MVRLLRFCVLCLTFFTVASISMQKPLATSEGAKFELNAKTKVEVALMKSETLAAVAKLDAATVCRGCGDGWYNWGGSMGMGGGNWFGDSMCGMSGYCSGSHSARRKHNRACTRFTKSLPAVALCAADQPKGTIIGAQLGPCKRYCGVGGSLANPTLDGTNGQSLCNIEGTGTTEFAAANPPAAEIPRVEDAKCAVNGAVAGAAADTGLLTNLACARKEVPAAGAANLLKPCGQCEVRPTGTCSACTCNVVAITNTDGAFFVDHPTDVCGVGESSCKPGTCISRNYVEIKTSQGHTLCMNQ